MAACRFGCAQQASPSSHALWVLTVTLNMQVGTGSRSEKIKTYNFKDSRVSDHRTKVNFDLNKVMNGDLESCIQACVNLDQEEQLAYIAES